MTASKNTQVFFSVGDRWK